MEFPLTGPFWEVRVLFKNKFLSCLWVCVTHVLLFSPALECNGRTVHLYQKHLPKVRTGQLDRPSQYSWRNLTPLSNICEAVLMSLLWTLNGLNELLEMLFEFLFNLGQVVWTPVSANQGLKFNLECFIFLSKALSQIIFSILFRVYNHQIVGKEN